MSPLPEPSRYIANALRALPSEKTLALLFPGQGSQKPGMGKEIAEASTLARRAFDIADDVLGSGFSRLCFAGPEEQLTQTSNAQPAVLVSSIAHLLAALQSGSLHARPAYLAGHSLGEYTALVGGGSLTLREALVLVRERGQLMESAGADVPGTMAALVGLNAEQVEEICGLSGAELANHNSPSQFVIGGPPAVVERASALARERGGRGLPLQVSGAFHTSLMRPAASQFAKALAGAAISDPQIPVVGNVTARPMTTAGEVRDDLQRQIINPVLWHHSLQAMIDGGVTTFIEIGSRVLTAMLKRSYPQVNAAALEGASALASPAGV